ncbi:hypothetical protein [Streptomyces sp. NBC_01314]|nr:hypothetical protein OG622_07045 [Streptomyces sp. NBC_01314]
MTAPVITAPASRRSRTASATATATAIRGSEGRDRARRSQR